MNTVPMALEQIVEESRSRFGRRRVLSNRDPPARWRRGDGGRQRLYSFPRQSAELFDRQAAGSDQAPQSSLGNFLVVRNRQRCPMPFLDQYHVAPPLTHQLPTIPSKHADNIPSAQCWQRRHQTVTSTCCVSTVNGMPRSARTSRHAAIASRILARTSSRDCPWLTQPGMAGHSAIQMPSSSRYSVVMNFMDFILTKRLAFEKLSVFRSGQKWRGARVFGT